MHDRLSSFLALTDTIKLAQRDLPKTGDGKYSYQVATKQTMPISGPTAAEIATHSKLTIFAQQAKALFGQKPSAGDAVKDVEATMKFIKAGLQAIEHPDAVDDRDEFFVEILALLCRLPQNTSFAKKANAKAITLLYNSLPHPPAAYIGTDPSGSVPWTQANAFNVPSGSAPPASSWSAGTPSSPGAPSQPSASSTPSSSAPARPAPPRAPWAFRAADGSGNNTWLPALGQSGRPYARDVQGNQPLPANKLPDAGEVFDALLRSDGDFKPHPGGNSALTFAFASLVTHSLFRTSPTDPTINNTTSYLDLSPLYGTNQTEQDMVRNKREGRGLLWNDAFAEDRLVLVPPAASALLVVFSRNHNYIAEILLKINERGRWKDPASAQLTEAQLAQQDEEIFQTARLVNCGHFMAMIFGDYVGGFLGLPRDGAAWCMNPFDPIKTENGEFLGRGEGNHVSVEFNLLYRWHAVTAEKDIQWTKDLFADVFPGKNPETLKVSDFGKALGPKWNQLVDPNPRTRTFGNLKRDAQGRFNDNDIANILQTATETPAGAYRARGHPAVLRAVEVMSIEQGRKWGVCTMNEFRQFLGLKPFATFEDWNKSVPGVAETARRLYGHIDNLELYPGLQAEDCMPLGPGSGICCGYTMTRAILGDAVALVRGDRFYTSDYTPSNLTSWGFQDCARDPNNGAFGAALPKLLMRHLPRHYPGNSIYSLFPFFTPSVMKENLDKLHLLSQYTDVEGKRPSALPIPKVVDTIDGIRYVFKDPAKYKTTYAHDMKLLTQGYGFMLSDDDRASHDKDRMWAASALFPQGKESLQYYAQEFKKMTVGLIAEYSYTLHGVSGTRIDIVGNVINLLTVRWAADYLIGIPLKTKDDPKGLFTEQEVHDMLSLLFTCALLNVQPENSWTLEHGAMAIAPVVQQLIEQNLKELSGNPVSALVGYVSSFVWPRETKKPYHEFLGRLQASGRDTKAIVAEVIGLAIGSSMIYAQGVAQIVDFYMDDARAAERADIIRLAQADGQTQEEKNLLLGYVREAQRLRPQASALLRTATVADTISLGDGRSPVTVQPGDVVFSSFTNANLNPKDFPDPLKVDPRRPADRYQLQGCGFHECLGLQFSEHTIPEVLKVIFRLKNLRRAEGVPGRLAGFTLSNYKTDSPVYLDDAGNLTNWPSSLTLVYDE